MLPYQKIWLLDFEFSHPDGKRLKSVSCMCAVEIFSGQRIELYGDALSTCPFETDESVLFVGYTMQAEMQCFLHLGWPLPVSIIDLLAEFRNLTNGDPRLRRHGSKLTGAMATFGLKHEMAVEKPAMQDLGKRGGPYTAEEIRALVDYCRTDVDGTAALFHAMRPHILNRAGVEPATNWRQAVLRGRFCADVAKVDRAGVPVNAPLLKRVMQSWDRNELPLIQKLDAKYNVFDGKRLNTQKLGAYLKREGVLDFWPRTPKGALSMQKEDFRTMGDAYPDQLRDLYELVATTGLKGLSELAPDTDDRHYFQAWPFGSKTARNQPSSTKAIFGPARWVRAFIQARPGKVIAYLDFRSEEFAIAAYLSGDKAMQEDYLRGDPYMAFAVRAGLAPDGDFTDEEYTKKYKAARNTAKPVVLAVQYGMGGESIARRLGVHTRRGHELLAMHKRAYTVFWKWHAARVLDCQRPGGRLQTPHGWQLCGPVTKARTAGNFLMQATGSDILRRAVARVHQLDIRIVAMVHDALMVEVDAEYHQTTIKRATDAMELASREVLHQYGGEVTVSYEPEGWVMPGQSYVPDKGGNTFKTIIGMLDEVTPKRRLPPTIAGGQTMNPTHGLKRVNSEKADPSLFDP